MTKHFSGETLSFDFMSEQIVDNKAYLHKAVMKASFLLPTKYRLHASPHALRIDYCFSY